MGHFENLALVTRYQVTKMVVNPGQGLSLQAHVERAEHWIVVEGKFLIRNAVQTLSENQSLSLNGGEIYRIENAERHPLVLIEVQTGRYLGEEDVLRHQDMPARS